MSIQKITKEELLNSNELSTGDLDVRALEIAINRYIQDEHIDNNIVEDWPSNYLVIADKFADPYCIDITNEVQNNITDLEYSLLKRKL